MTTGKLAYIMIPHSNLKKNQKNHCLMLRLHYCNSSSFDVQNHAIPDRMQIMEQTSCMEFNVTMFLWHLTRYEQSSINLGCSITLRVPNVILN